MINPVPRPALRKAHDAHLHPAAPGRPGPRLAPQPGATPSSSPAPTPPAGADDRPAEPPAGELIPPSDTTSPSKHADTTKPAKLGKGARAGGKDEGKKSSKRAGRSTPGAGKPGTASSRSRLSGPLAGSTSDSLRAVGKSEGTGKRKKAKEKLVDLTVRVPKSLRKDLRAAAKANRRSQDEVVTALLRGWLGN